MKNERGITLVALIIYIILLLIVTALLSSISMFFYSNVEYLEEESKNIAEYNKFNMYFIQDIKSNDDIESVNDNEIILKDGTIYTFVADPDNGIYRNKVKICDNVAYCKFSNVNHESKKIVNVRMVIKGDKLFDTSNNYVLKYW